jgi:queuine tRNA-ribosyltransferase
MNTSLTFRIKTKQKKARRGELKIGNVKIQTPAFMPIGTLGSIKSLDNEEIEKLGYDLILGNTYHLWLKPGMQVFAQLQNQSKLIKAKDTTDLESLKSHLGGLHKFNNYEKLLLTDSGGFQAWSLSKSRKFTEEGVYFNLASNGQTRLLTPEKSIQIQTVLGSNIALVLDQVVNAEVDYQTAKKAMERTHRWAKRCQDEFLRLKNNSVKILASDLDLPILEKPKVNKNGQIDPAQLAKFERIKKKLTQNNVFVDTQNLSKDRFLFGIPQGAMYLDLRQTSAKAIMEMNFDGYSIGGVAQGGEAEEVMYQQVLSQTELLEDDKPRHLLGVGTPENIVEMVKRGIDLFDCVYPTRNARHGSIFIWRNKSKFEYETIKIKSQKFVNDFSPINQNSKIKSLRNYSKAYLNHLFKAGELLAYRLATLQNLEFYADLMEEIRNKIEANEL